MRSRLKLIVGMATFAALTVISCAPASVATPTDGAADVGGAAGSRVDFNGDGFADLAVATDGGEAVHVIYGSPTGLTAVGNQLWSQDSPGIEGVTWGNNQFGASLAAGDFNGDGFGDLAVGSPNESESVIGAGAINVIYGSPAGLTSAGNQFWDQNSPGIAGTAESGDAFASSLAAANFGNSAHDDLLVGTPQEVVGEIPAGVVQVLYGSAGGLTSVGNRMWSQDSKGIASRAEDGDNFGSALAAADFGKSRYADAAVSSAGEDVGRVADAGVVHVLFGSATGLRSSGSQVWSLDSRGVPGAADGDDFGRSVVAANFGRDGHADLAVGAPFKNAAQGAVVVLYGSNSGLTAAGSQFWSQDTKGIKGVGEHGEYFGVEYGDFFGGTLAAANLGNTRHADLAVGVPFESVGDVQKAGGVNVIYGSAKGLTSAGDQFWSESGSGIEGDIFGNGWFGSSLAAGNFGNSGPADLAVGAPNVAVDGREGAGVVHLIHGSTTGLTSVGDEVWSLYTPGMLGEAKGFGWSLIASP